MMNTDVQYGNVAGLVVDTIEALSAGIVVSAASAGRYRFFVCEDDEENGVKNFCIFKGRQGVTTGDWGIDRGWKITDIIRDMKTLDYREISRLEALLLTGQDLGLFYEDVVR